LIEVKRRGHPARATRVYPIRSMVAFPRLFAALAVASALFVAGCAGGTQVQAQWSDPQFAGRSLRGAKVLVVCDAAEAVIRRICQDKLAAQVAAAGATTVTVREDLSAGPSDRTLAAARKAGATAVFGSTIAQEAGAMGAGPQFGIGVGGIGGSGGGGISGGGVGISFPIGGGGAQLDPGYVADMLVTDVASGRLMWTSKVTTSGWSDLDTQIGELVRAGVQAAEKAGVL
jgi:hypothetical protein